MLNNVIPNTVGKALYLVSRVAVDGAGLVTGAREASFRYAPLEDLSIIAS